MKLGHPCGRAARGVLSGNLDSPIHINVHRSVKWSTRRRSAEKLRGLIRGQSIVSATTDLPHNRQRAFTQVQLIVVAGYCDLYPEHRQ